MRQYSDTVHIILTDDDSDEFELFKDAFHSLNVKHKLDYFRNGRELMDFLNAPDNPVPDILFLDLNMPVMSGIECLHEIRADKRFKSMPIAIYSTSSSEKDQHDTFMGGANIYIRKPDSFEEMKRIIRHVLKVSWQFHTSSLNMDTFILSISN
jgi:DNA-binding response OmpR family regulator